MTCTTVRTMVHTFNLLDLPQEIILYILSFLDLPDLATLSKLHGYLALLAADPVLHLIRLRVVAPSRVGHSLFARSPHGTLLRPTITDLVHRHVIRGHNIERRLRMGLYIYTEHSVGQYDSGLRLQRERIALIISSHLRRRVPASAGLKLLYHSHILPDVESSLLSVSRSLLPVVRKLKWSIQRDKLANEVRGLNGGALGNSALPFTGNLGAWIELKGQGVVKDCERVRLALCPDVRRMVRFYEGLGH
ncbi:hypothetical protein DEU56DRAFT_767955 [Suillus clintonianus]|uniref:uncharacterized protein n=1 Tax=Suillus clintonianus TaxID=1904413 RepID=UPI001B8676F5|nr:uncharacterized protein DEU56DRAFT_767955 [Suillus clintonianus]KAG2155538.1 hypothetical protein DEU56DRAFT_767955 [Suillus clintonianus]